MAKKKLLWIIVLAVITVFAVCLAACGDKATRYSIKWEVSENATVTVEDSDELPSEAKEGSTVSFTVEADKGYEVSAVRVNDRTVSADSSGKYNVIIRSNTTIKVETEDTVESIAVTTNPSTMTYYEGQTLDPTGMVVSVTYAGSGDTVAVDNYTVVYQNGNAFALGDTSFSVKYLGVESAPVQLEQEVEVLITIDPVGGTLDAGYLSGLQANSELHDVAQDEDGVITFSYSAITAAIALPTSEMWEKGEQEGDFIFNNWNVSTRTENEEISNTEIAATNLTTRTYTAAYTANLVNVTSVSYELEMEEVPAEDPEGETTYIYIPYLVIEGTYNAATQLTLFFHEGNKNITLEGDSFGSADASRGDTFELRFDMRKLAEQKDEGGNPIDYLGSWLDIKFGAVINGIEESQDIYSLGVDVNQNVNDGDYIYGFAEYNGMLKAVVTVYFQHEFTFSAEVDKDGDLVVTFTGTVNKEFAGNAVQIDTWSNDSDVAVGEIDAEGNYTVELTIADTPLDTDGYFHLKIVESVDNSTEVAKPNNEANLPNNDCVNDNLEIVNFGLIENNYGLKVSNETGTRVFYVGFGKWGGFVFRGVNEAVERAEIEITGVTLETANEKPYLVVNGTYLDTLTDDDIISIMTADLFAELLNNGQSDSGSTSTDWTGTQLSYIGTEEAPATVLLEVSEGTWKMSLDLSARNNTIGEVLFAHLSFTGGKQTNLESTNIDAETKITFTEADGDNIEFSLGEYTGWGGHVVSIYVKDASQAAA